MKRIIFLSLITVIIVMACKNETAEQEQVSEEPTNPFFSEFETPFQAPPFDLIDTTHYVPAFEKGIEEHQAEIDAIVNNEEAPTFENTILALDQSGKLLRKVRSVFFSLNSSITNEQMQAIARKVSPMITQHSDNINLNETLFQKIKTVWENIDNAELTELQKRVVNKYYKDFVRNGADLNENDKETLREINQKLSKLQLQFDENLLAETNTNFKLIIEDEKELAGLPQGVIDAAATTAIENELEGKWVFTLQKPSLLPFLQYSDNRDLREQIYRGYFMRGNNDNEFDNKEAIKSTVNLRAEKVKLLGYNTYAEYIIEKNMAKTPEKVYDFLNKIMPAALDVSKKDLAEMQAIIDAEGGDFKLASWDWWYYAEKLKKQKFDLEESEIQPYFVLENVRDGMFYVATQLYGITFEKRNDIPLYHQDVEVFEVKEEDGSHMGLLYCDYHPRDSKDVGAWCGGFRDQGYENGEKIYPLVYIVCNFTKPSGETPALLTWDETTTLFHEFGHALHGLFTDGEYNRVAGNVPRDMVELPSQIMENWAGQPEVLKVYAKHYETGEIIPQELVDKIQASSVFNQGFATVEYIAASILDLDWHSFTEAKPDVDVLEYEKQSMDNINLIDEIIPRYRTTYFGHINGGYAAGYYVYLWAEVLDSDAFNAFVESGDLYNKEIAAKFRTHILQDGGNDEGMIQYDKFRGKEPSLDPLLEKRGLK